LGARDRIQAMVDQRFFTEKYQIDRTLKQLNQASGYLADPSALAEITLGTCRDVMDAAVASMYVRDPKGMLRLIGTDEQADIPGTLPAATISGTHGSELVIRRVPAASRDHQEPLQRLLHEVHAELICLLRGDSGVDGIIVLGKRTNGSPYSPEDIAFLQAIGQMTVLALHSSRANQNLSR
ncbi:MAG: GAF domain-containing protein, partial [Fuerstiella sp.]|nr:GAF domain-containing protein [Fuerstiella sp.]